MHKREITVTIQADFFEENPSQKEIQDFVSAVNNAIDEASLTSEPQILPDSAELVPLPPEVNRDYMIGYIGRFVRNQGGTVTSKDMELDVSPCVTSTNQTQILVDTIHENSVEVSTFVADQLEAIDDMEWEELSDEIVEEIYDNIKMYEEDLDVQEQKDHKNGL